MDEKRTAGNATAGRRDMQKQAACVAGDIDAVARYWAIRKQELLADAASAFISFVEPAFLYDMPPFIEPDSFNVMFTEWMLFEYPFRNGRTPLEEYAAHPPAGAKALHLDHVRQICETQIFSRFIIHDKDARSGMAALEDIQTARRYDVYDPELCKRARWRSGTIGERIACVDGLWVPIANTRLYDRAAPADTALDGPGFFHPEDRVRKPEAEHASFYLRLVRDIIGIDGRYRHTATIPPDEEQRTRTRRNARSQGA